MVRAGCSAEAGSKQVSERVLEIPAPPPAPPSTCDA